MAQAQNIRHADIADEVSSLRERDNAKDFFRVLLALMLIIVGYFQFAPEDNAAQEITVVAAKK